MVANRYCMAISTRKTHNFPLPNSTGKERDEETGYGYFGARYMDHELMTMWLSVDPMADKYPSISPYAYCAWNPVRLIDPDGNDWYQYTNKNGKTMVKWTNSHNQAELNDELKNRNVKNAQYLGVTVETQTTYFGLMGDIVSKTKDAERCRFVKDLDNAIINRAMAKTIRSAKPTDFSNVFDFEPGGTNVRTHYSYAGGVAGIGMNNHRDRYGRIDGMEGRFNDMRKPDGRSLRSYGVFDALEAPRYSIYAVNILHQPEIAAISFAKEPSMADRFDRILDGLKGRPLMHATRNGNGWKRTRY